MEKPYKKNQKKYFPRIIDVDKEESDNFMKWNKYIMYFIFILITIIAVTNFKRIIDDTSMLVGIIFLYPSMISVIRKDLNKKHYVSRKRRNITLIMAMIVLSFFSFLMYRILFR